MHRIAVTVLCRLRPPLSRRGIEGFALFRYWKPLASFGRPTISESTLILQNLHHESRFPLRGNGGQNVTRNGGPQSTNPEDVKFASSSLSNLTRSSQALFWGARRPQKEKNTFRASSTTTRDRSLCNFGAPLSTGGSPLDFFAFSPVFYVHFSKAGPQKNWRK